MDGLKVLLAALMLSAWPIAAAHAAAVDEAPIPEKPLTNALSRDLLIATRGAARLGVKFLKALQNENQDKSRQPIWFPPKDYTVQELVGYKDIQVTRPVYKKVTLMIPTQKVTGYKWVWVTEKDPNDPYAPAGRKRIQEPIIEIVGKHPEERWLPDGDKTQVVTEKYPIYQDKEPSKIYYRWLEGENALALLSLLAAGEPPDSEPVARAAVWLYEGTCDQHGIPDTTYELSLFIMVFAQLDREKYGKLTDAMLEKLIHGQADDGACRGFWGVYSIDAEQLKALQVKEMKGVIIRDKIAADIQQDKQALAATAVKREQARIQARIDQNEKNYEKIMAELKKVREKICSLSREFTRGDDWNKVRRSERLGGDIRFYPWAIYDARFTQRTDITTTHFALLALREAARHGLLKPDSPLGKELNAAIARTAHALKAQQQTDGSWGYCVQEQSTKPVEDPKGVKPQEKPNEPSMAATAAGLACFDIIAELAGAAKVREGFADTVDKARDAVIRHLDAYSKPGAKPATPVDTQFGPPYYYFALASALDDPVLGRLRAAAIPQGVLCRLLFSQQNDGSWPVLPYYAFGSSTYMRSRWSIYWTQSGYDVMDHRLVNSCYAILSLCEAARPSIGAAWQLADKPDYAAETELDDLRNALARDAKTWFRRQRVQGELADGLAPFVPALVIRADADPQGIVAASKAALGKYLEGGGLLIVQRRAGGTVDAGVKKVLSDLYADVAFKPLPAAHPAFHYMAEVPKPPEVEGAWRGDRLLAAFLPADALSAGGAWLADPRDTVRNLLAAQAHLKEPDAISVVGPKDWAEVEKAVEAALANVKEQKIEPPKVEPPTEKKPEPAKPDEPKKPDDTKKPDEPKKEPPEKSVDDLIKEINEPDPANPDKPKNPKPDERF